MEAKTVDWSESTVKFDVLLESFLFLQDTAEGDQDRYHPNLVNQFGRLVWFPKNLDKESLPSATKQTRLSREPPLEKYDLKARSGRQWHFWSFFYTP